MGTAQAFWSYVHEDDDAMHGAIRRLAQHVQDEYAVLTGGPELDLFLDNAKIKWGDKWRSRIKEALEQTTFFIPIVTPRYFASKECLNELFGFAEQAEKLGLEGLIMPLYLVDVPALEARELSDPAVQLIADSQMKDWRTLRFLDETTQPYRLAIHELADRLLEATREREKQGSVEPAPASSDADDDEGPEPTHPSPSTPPTKASNEKNAPVAVAEMGTLELLAEGEAAMPRITETLNAISTEISSVGELATKATTEIEQSDENGGGFKGRLTVANRLAKNLVDPADRLEQLTSQYMADLVVLDPAITQLITLVAEQSNENPSESKEFFSAVTGMVKNTREAGEGIKVMVTSLDESASFSRELGVPLKKMRASLQSMIDGQRMIEAWEEHVKQATEQYRLSQ